MKWVDNRNTWIGLVKYSMIQVVLSNLLVQIYDTVYGHTDWEALQKPQIGFDISSNPPPVCGCGLFGWCALILPTWALLVYFPSSFSSFLFIRYCDLACFSAWMQEYESTRIPCLPQRTTCNLHCTHWNCNRELATSTCNTVLASYETTRIRWLIFGAYASTCTHNGGSKPASTGR